MCRRYLEFGADAIRNRILSSDPDEKPKKETNQGIVGAGIAIGVGVGLAIGNAMDNVGAGLAIGLAIGIAVGAGIQRKKKSENEKD